MVYIEVMIHQVKVKENQRNLMQFLWWEHGNSVNK